MTSIYMLIGFPASTKTTQVAELMLAHPGAVHISRDITGGSVASLIPTVESLLREGKTVILDNTHMTIAARAQFIAVARRLSSETGQSVPVHAIYMKTTIEDCQIRNLTRMYSTHGTLYMTGKLPAAVPEDPHVFPPAVYFAARKSFEEPAVSEGFASVRVIKVPAPSIGADYCNKALFLDIDGTVRATEHLEYKYPVKSEEVTLLHDAAAMRAKLEAYRVAGYRLIGVSNQSGIAKKTVTTAAVEATFERTRALLGYTAEEFPILYCPHCSVPIQCYCRKPQSGMFVKAILEYKLNPAACLMVGDRKTDETAAKRVGIPYKDVSAFW
jgi:D-glycero-D-manno-heptose 1,7-bisphosphate phosphatase